MREDSMKKNLLFLCTGNSARSQMAEGFARHWGDNEWQVASAGLEPGSVHRLAIEVMAEAGIDISHHTSKPITKELLESADIIITLCGDAKERCPLARSKPRHHWPLPDPARVTGDDEKKQAAFRQVRDELAQRIRDFLPGQTQ